MKPKETYTHARHRRNREIIFEKRKSLHCLNSKIKIIWFVFSYLKGYARDMNAQTKKRKCLQRKRNTISTVDSSVQV